MTGGVFEFTRVGTFPPPVLAQATTTPVPANTLMTLSLDLGNTSTVRKRVLVLANDADFSSFVACAWWLPPGQPLAPYVMHSYTSEAWSAPSVSIYPSTPNGQPWTQLDNVVLQTTPGLSIPGTQCLEGGAASAWLASNGAASSSGTTLVASMPGTSLVESADSAFQPAGQQAPARAIELGDDRLSSPDGTWVKDGDEWTTSAAQDEAHAIHGLRWTAPIDLTSVTDARLTFTSQLTAIDSRAHVQVSIDEDTWMTVALVGSSETWQHTEVDLSGFRGQVVHVRFAFEAAPPDAGAAIDVWRVRDVQLDVSTRDPGTALARSGAGPATEAPRRDGEASTPTLQRSEIVPSPPGPRHQRP